MNKHALRKAYQDAKKEAIETTAEGRSFLRSRYQFYNRKGSEQNMGSKIIWVGVGLSNLGLGYFLPVLIPAGAIILCVGVIAVVLDK